MEKPESETQRRIRNPDYGFSIRPYRCPSGYWSFHYPFRTPHTHHWMSHKGLKYLAAYLNVPLNVVHYVLTQIFKSS